MFQTFEDFTRSFCVRCSDVGLNCECVICEDSEEKVLNMTIMHMFEYHAINPKEITSEMKSKIERYMVCDSVRANILQEDSNIS